jgi:hypothetical protein
LEEVGHTSFHDPKFSGDNADPRALVQVVINKYASPKAGDGLAGLQWYNIRTNFREKPFNFSKAETC